MKQIPPLRHAGSVPSVGMTGRTGGCVGFVALRIGFVLRKKGLICRGVSTSVEGSLIENAKIKVQSAKLRNPGLAGMGVLVVASFSISRILYLLDVYYTSCGVGCQVNFLARRTD